MSAIIVTKLERAEDGHWRARVSADGTTIPVTRQFGSWTTLPDGTGRFCELRPDIAAALQARLPKAERTVAR